MRFVSGAVAGLVFLGTVATAGFPECKCADAKLKGGWCPACKVGYLASIRIESKLLYEELDAHGHDIDPASIKCPTCRKAIETNGYCESCRMGFVGKQAYLSRLAYHLAKGRATDPSKILCPVCKKNAEKYGWCDACKTGMVANVAITDRPDFDIAVKAYELVALAAQTAKRCEMCAVAMIYDSRCYDCKISYKDGQPQAAPKTP